MPVLFSTRTPVVSVVPMNGRMNVLVLLVGLDTLYARDIVPLFSYAKPDAMAVCWLFSAIAV